MPASISELVEEVQDTIGRQLRQVVRGRRELRRRRYDPYEYDHPWSEGTWAWIAIIGTLALGLAASQHALDVHVATRALFSVLMLSPPLLRSGL